MEKLTANVTHSKRDKPKPSRWDVTHVPIIIALEILLLSNTSIRYHIKINNCSPVPRKAEMQSDLCVQVQKNQESALLQMSPE